MKTTRQHIMVALGAIMILFASCSRDEGEVIPRNKLADIYAEMLVTDQWITSTPGIRSIADTSLVYEPILKKYGYTSADYRKSIDKYMDDPERFSRILRTTGEILDARIDELIKEQVRLLALSKLPRIEYDFKFGELAPCIAEEYYIHTYDSLDVVRDSATLVFRCISIEREDTLYEGLRMIIKDSPAVADSLAAADSLQVDSLKTDSLKVRPFIPDTLKTRQNMVRRPNLLVKGNRKVINQDTLKVEEKK